MTADGTTQSRQPAQQGRTGDRIHILEIGAEAAPGDTDTVGGWPVLAPDLTWPSCTCGTRMLLFFQVGIPVDVPVFGGDRLLVFQCPDHNEAVFAPDSEQLTPRYWEVPPPPNEMAFWRILLRRGPGVVAPEPDPVLTASRLTMTEATELVDESGRGRDGFKIGGRPWWAQDPEHYRCACGADLVFLCQVPEYFDFPRSGGHEPPDAVSADDYVLFLGNCVYVFACSAHCDPAAAWPVNQN